MTTHDAQSSERYTPSFPIGQGQTDYEKYLRTVELLSLQKPEAETVSPEELLFQVTHQASELWMKLMMHELDRILEWFPKKQDALIIRSFRLIADCQRLIIQQVDLLAHAINIVEYGKIRTALGQGSGLESPGFNWLLEYPPQLWTAFTQRLASEPIDLETIYTHYSDWGSLHTLAECLMDFDDLFHKWRTHHIDLVARTIGLDSNSLKGIPTQVLQRGVLERFFPELLALRGKLTNQSALAYGGHPL